ncbi:MAG TPA: hypothetical protein VFV99_27995 [Kofleriaceae bacterium]|nr:hypothetical protein [Kofleriaceae bacterium]
MRSLVGISLACSLFAFGCASDERPEDMLPSCHEPIELTATVANTTDPLIKRSCFDAAVCAARDGFGVLDDIDPNVPGPQYACAVSDLAECTPYQGPPANAPCWRVAIDTTCMTTQEHLALEVVYAVAPLLGTALSGSCMGECNVLHQIGRCAPVDP